jgi:NitT/TauT family transport system ATP-binding protein
LVKLTVERVGHRYDNLVVLEDINVDVRPGEILALIGPSGCGKSTLLGIMGGILQPTSGHVLMTGPIPHGCLNTLTYIFQDFALLPWRTVEGNVSLALEHHPLAPSDIDARIQDALSRTGLTEFRKAFPKQLSGGMRQRVGIARALVVNPAILLMDEPLSALDAQTRELLMEDILALWLRETITAVYVTHNLEEALRLANRVCVLSRRPGRVRAIIDVTTPQAERGGTAGRAEIADLHADLWDLIKVEAQVAEREVSNG